MEKDGSASKEKTGFRIEHWQQVSIYLVIYDAAAVSLSYFAALLLRFDFRFSTIPVIYLYSWAYFAPVYAVLCIIVFRQLRLYRSIWRFASFTEFRRVILSSVITTAIHVAGSLIVVHLVSNYVLHSYSVSRMPISYYMMGAIIQFVLIMGIRFSYRFVLLLRSSRDNKAADRVLLVGKHSIIGTT